MVNEKKLGCLLLHGFCGSQREINPLAEALKVNGYQVVTPVLKGHTGLRQDLIGVTHEDWLESAREGLKELRQTCDQVVAIGFSMGGLLAINLAKEYELDGLVTINTPVYIWALRQIGANIWEDIRSRSYCHLQHYITSARRAPFQAQWQFLLLLWKTKPLLDKLFIPKALVLQTADDPTVKPKSGKYIYQHLNSPGKSLKYYPQGGHLVLLSPSYSQVIKDVENFLVEI
ncbi:MAG: alpha/beta hydrolase [Zhaonellaceae bacterium]